MKKLAIVCLCVLFFLVGCTQADTTNQTNDAENEAYYLQVALANDEVITDDSDTPILRIQAEKPQIVAAANEKTEAVVNAYFESTYQNFLQEVESMESEIREYADDVVAEMGYFAEEKIVDAIAYDQVLSVIYQDNYYTGGAHGYPYRWALNFDMKSGEKIEFSDLTDEEDVLRSEIIEQILTQIEQNQSEYDPEMFFELTEEAFRDGFTENTWYLSKEGLCVLYNPYSVAPYAAGILQFTIPFESLSALKETYWFTGAQDNDAIAYVQKEPSAEQSVCQWILDPDGEDIFCVAQGDISVIYLYTLDREEENEENKSFKAMYHGLMDGESIAIKAKLTQEMPDIQMEQYENQCRLILLQDPQESQE